ncbi:MAG: DUF4861 family protein [Patiriisocius sp.]|uniref:DUF4861 family protein n=1 Tax=Patiriisocius sp. TaxID=2822396 RepID=UPI003EF79DE9
MKKIKYISIALSILALHACKNKEEVKEQNEQPVLEKKDVQKTYAEISVAEGGEWKDRVYEGGTSFKNVESLTVPQSHTDHSWYLRYEGPGWESDKVGYRLYLDWRNAIDIFGKTTHSMVLKNVGQDGFDSYHEKQSWGSDILKVGKGLGLGSIGRLVNDEVKHFREVDSTKAAVNNATEMSSVDVNYYGWKTGEEKIDLSSTLSIFPGERYTKHTIQPSKSVAGIVTGIVNHGVTFLEGLSENKQWAYIATYGEQTLVPDDLGMAIFYNVATVTQMKKGVDDYLLEFEPTTQPITFYFLGAWEQEKDGIKTEKEFTGYLNEKLKILNKNQTL